MEWPDAVTTLIIINVVVFVMQHLLGMMVDPLAPRMDRLWGTLSLPALMQGHVWTLVTHLFVHHGIWHILPNCIMIMMAGRWLLSLVGRNRFLYIYFASGVCGALTQLVVEKLFGNNLFDMRIIGASASATGVFLACAAMQPREEVTALLYWIIPIRTKLWTMAMVLMGASLVMGVMQLTGHSFEQMLFGKGMPSVAHFAHLGGALAGWYAARLLGYTGRPIHYDDLQRQRLDRDRERAYAGPKRKRRAVDMDDPDNLLVPPRTSQELIAREIDPILDKMSAHGKDSLTEEEHRILKQASAELAKLKR
jgi:membrane associated rhomboid family serine protease